MKRVHEANANGFDKKQRSSLIQAKRELLEHAARAYADATASEGAKPAADVLQAALEFVRAERGRR